MYKLVKYNDEHKLDWDGFIATAKNSSFLFIEILWSTIRIGLSIRRFFFSKKKVVAVIPGHVDGDTFCSHNGLSYGGMVLSAELGIESILHIFELLNSELKRMGIVDVIYKPVPYIYHRVPAQEDLYALFQLKAERIACNIASTVFQNKRLPFKNSRRDGIRKGKKNNIEVVESNDYALFWDILNDNLKKKYNTQAVHSLNEIEYLKSKFPKNIRMFLVFHTSKLVAGTVLFNNKNIVHVQYTSSTEQGRRLGALDFLFDKLLNETFVEVPIFDFGISTERMGEVLNKKLIYQKEGFGGRGVVYETYSYKLI